MLHQTVICSATGSMEKFRIHKIDINTGKIRCGVGNYFLMFVNLPSAILANSIN